MQGATKSRKQSNVFAEELLDLSNKLTGISPKEIDDAIKNTITRLGQFLHMDHAFHIVFDVEKGGLMAEFEWCNEGIPSMTEQMLKTTFDDSGSIFEKLSQNECVLLPSIKKDLPKSWKSERALFDKNGFQSIFMFPIMNESKLMGFIGLDSITGSKKFSSNELYLLKVWGAMLSALIKNKRSELLIQQKQENAERANRAKSEFLSRMSHELRTPLNSIIGFAQLLEITPLNEPQKKSVAHIRTSGDYLLNLINEVLDITRIEAGKLKLNLEPIRIDYAILEMLDVIQSQAANKNIRFITAFKVDAFQLCTDALRFRQIMLNLINNAVKYNREGGEITIKAECANLSTNGVEGIRISVRDNGFGIHPDKLPHLFNPFERAGAEYSNTEGTGLGLAVVKKLVTILGGDVFVESELDMGSNFWIELPLKHPEKEIPCTETLRIDVHPEKRFNGKILYVEDNHSNIEVFEMMLSKLRPGIELVVRENGRNLIDFVLEQKPDMILLDLNLPDISGDELCDKLKSNQDTKNIPIVVLSADAMDDRIRKLLQKDVKHYITKPFVIKNMLGVIDEFVIPS